MNKINNIIWNYCECGGKYMTHRQDNHEKLKTHIYFFMTPEEKKEEDESQEAHRQLIRDLRTLIKNGDIVI